MQKFYSWRRNCDDQQCLLLVYNCFAKFVLSILYSSTKGTSICPNLYLLGQISCPANTRKEEKLKPWLVTMVVMVRSMFVAEYSCCHQGRYFCYCCKQWLEARLGRDRDS